MLLAPFKCLAIMFALPVLGGCSALVADLVILPFRIVGEGVEYAMEDHGSDGVEDSEETGEATLAGYCYDSAEGIAYPLYSFSSDAECAPGVHAISKAEYDKFVVTRAQAYCAKAVSGWLYRASAKTCADGDETLTRSDYEARARVYPLRASL